MDKEHFKDMLKILVLGAAGVGKTELIEQLSDKSLHEDIAPKAGVNFFVKIINVDGDQYKLQFWDIIDNKKFGSLQTMYYTGASAVFFIFDLSKPDTFDYSKTHFKKILDQAKSDNCPIILVGNRQELVENQKTIEREKYRRFVKEEGLLGYLELKSSDSIDNLLKVIPNIIQNALKKSYQVKFLVNRKELEEIKTYARKSHQTQSEFIRTAIWEKIQTIDDVSMTKSLKKEKFIDQNYLRNEELKKIRELLEKLK
jgi:small GTP-binding protein